MKETPQTNRLILTILAVIVGFFMVIVAPVLIQTSMERVVAENECCCKECTSALHLTLQDQPNRRDSLD